MIDFALPDAIKEKRDLGLEGSVSFGKTNGNIIPAKWTLDGVTINVTYDLTAKTISVPNNTPQKRIDFIRVAIKKHDYKKAREAGVQKLRETAQTAAGIPFEQLSKDQLNAMLQLFMLRALEFGEDGEARIKAPKRWVEGD